MSGPTMRTLHADASAAVAESSAETPCLRAPSAKKCRRSQLAKRARCSALSELLVPPLSRAGASFARLLAPRAFRTDHAVLAQERRTAARRRAPRPSAAAAARSGEVNPPSPGMASSRSARSTRCRWRPARRRRKAACRDSSRRSSPPRRATTRRRATSRGSATPSSGDAHARERPATVPARVLPPLQGVAAVPLPVGARGSAHHLLGTLPVGGPAVFLAIALLFQISSPSPSASPSSSGPSRTRTPGSPPTTRPSSTHRRATAAPRAAASRTPSRNAHEHEPPRRLSLPSAAAPEVRHRVAIQHLGDPPRR